MGDANRGELYYVEESTWGTTPTAALTELRHTGESIGQNTGSIISDEIRGDRQVPDVIRNNIESAGGFNFELSYGALDDMLEGALMSDWSSDINISGTDISAANSDNSFNSSDPVYGTNFSSLVVGQWILVAGFTETANNGYFQVVSVAAGKIVVSNGTLTTESAGDSVTMNGSYIRNGTTKKSYTLEKKFADLSSVRYVSVAGARVNDFNITAAINSIITGSIGFMGKACASAAATVGTGSPNDPPTNDVMNVIDHIKNPLEGGSTPSVYLTEVSIALNNALRTQPALANLGPIGIGIGTVDLSGSLTAYFEDETLYEKHLNFTSTSLSFRTEDGDGNAYVWTLPAIKYTAGNPLISGKDQDVFASLNWAAYRDTTTDCMIQIDRFSA